MTDGDNHSVNQARPSGMVRWSIPAVLLVSVIISYMDRNNLSYALPKIGDEFGWTNEQRGTYDMLLFLCFFFSYGLANMIFSPLGEKYGPKRAIMAAVVCFSLFTMAGAGAGHMLGLFMFTRVLLGLGEGVHFPMNSKLIKTWFPSGERSRANGLWIAGVMIALIITPVIIVPVVDHFGWRFMFVALGVAGAVITLPLVYLFVYNSPGEHPRVGADEAEYIAAGMEAEPESGESSWVRIKPLLRQPAFLVAMAAGVFNNAASYGLMQWLPIYLRDGRGMDFKDLWWGTSLPYVFGVIGIGLASWLGDRVGRRALMAGVCYLVTGVIAFFAATGATIIVTVVLFAVAIFFQSAYTSQEFTILQRIVPKDIIGSGSGFYNGVAMMVGGVLGHVIVGTVVSYTGDFTAGIVALLTMAFLAGGALLVLHRIIKY